jgi:hypothetical protein
MKKSLLLLVSVLLLSSFADYPVKPDYIGTWRAVETNSDKKVYEFVLLFKQNKHSDKIDVYRKQDAKPLYTLTMLDDTHFKTKHVFTETIGDNVEVEHYVTGYFENMKAYVKDHSVRKTHGSTNTLVAQNDFNHVYRRWDPDQKKYKDKPEDIRMKTPN